MGILEKTMETNDYIIVDSRVGVEAVSRTV